MRKFGKWTVIGRTKDNRCKCECECGTIRQVWKSHLIRGKSTSCGCLTRKNLTGRKFGKLTVIKYSHINKRGSGNNTRTDRMWLCDCDCGNTICRSTSDLKVGKISSCGCYLKRKVEYGLSSKKIVYNIYKKLCAAKRKLEFQLEFDTFIELLQRNCYYCGSQPSMIQENPRGNGDFIHNGLDRVDNDKGYTTDNVVPCCDICNRAKGTLKESQYFLWLVQVRHYIKETQDGQKRQNLG